MISRMRSLASPAPRAMAGCSLVRGLSARRSVAEVVPEEAARSGCRRRFNSRCPPSQPLSAGSATAPAASAPAKGQTLSSSDGAPAPAIDEPCNRSFPQQHALSDCGSVYTWDEAPNALYLARTFARPPAFSPARSSRFPRASRSRCLAFFGRQCGSGLLQYGRGNRRHHGRDPSAKPASRAFM